MKAIHPHVVVQNDVIGSAQVATTALSETDSRSVRQTTPPRLGTLGGPSRHPARCFDCRPRQSGYAPDIARPLPRAMARVLGGAWSRSTLSTNTETAADGDQTATTDHHLDGAVTGWAIQWRSASTVRASTTSRLRPSRTEPQQRVRSDVDVGCSRRWTCWARYSVGTVHQPRASHRVVSSVTNRPGRHPPGCCCPAPTVSVAQCVGS